MTTARTELVPMALSRDKLQQILAIIETVGAEFPHEFDLGDLEQETLEVALDDAVVALIKGQFLKRRFAEKRTLANALVLLFGEQSDVAAAAQKLETSTSEYTDAFSPFVAREHLNSLLRCIQERVDEAKDHAG